MAEKYLGKTFDIHTGGIDNVFPHHEDEIAQSEAVFDAKHVNYWIHGQHLLADGAKMAKSSGNVFMVSDLIERGFDPIAFRYLCLTVRYRHRMNFTFSSLRASQKALDSLRLKLWQWKSTGTYFKPTASTIKLENEFIEIIENDLDLPKGVAFIWNLVKSEISNAEKFYLITKFDSILGLGLDEMPTEYLIPEIIKTHNIKRQTLRASQKFQDSDNLRSLIYIDGYIVQDDLEQSTIRPKTYLERIQSKWPSISSPKEIKSNLDNLSNLEYTFILNAYGYKEDIQRCVESIARYAVAGTYEIK